MLVIISGPTNPGFLQVRLFNLRENTLQVVELPSRRTKTSPFNFTFQLGHGKYDLGKAA